MCRCVSQENGPMCLFNNNNLCYQKSTLRCYLLIGKTLLCNVISASWDLPPRVCRIRLLVESHSQGRRRPVSTAHRPLEFLSAPLPYFSFSSESRFNCRFFTHSKLDTIFGLVGFAFFPSLKSLIDFFLRFKSLKLHAKTNFRTGIRFYDTTLRKNAVEHVNACITFVRQIHLPNYFRWVNREFSPLDSKLLF